MPIDDNSSQLFTRGKLGLAVSAACTGMAPGATAQETGDTARLEEIVVTATKRELSLQDIPMSIVAITAEDIFRLGFKQIDDYVGQIPALSTATREPGGSNVIMRGCATSGVAFADTQTTAVYLDEQPISVAGVNPDPRLIDIERIEALSGPQGTLFGDSSQCGTLRIITNKPDTEEFAGWVDLTAMSIQDGDQGYEVSAMLNIPFADNNAALRLVGFYADEAGYIDNILGVSPRGVVEDGGGNVYFPGGTFDNSEYAKADINQTTVTGGRAGLRFQPGKNWQFDLQAAYQNTEADGFGDTDLPENHHAGDPLGQWEQMRFGNDRWSDEWYQLAMDIEGSLGWGELTIAASFINRQNRYDADSTAYLTAWQDFNATFQNYYGADCCTIYDFGGDPQAMSFEDSDQDRTSLEIRLATPSDSTSRWSGVIGAFYNKSEDHTHFSANVRQLATAEGVYAFNYLNYYAFTEFRCVGGYDPNPPYYCASPYYDPLSTQVGNSSATVKWWDGVYNTNLEQVALFGEVDIELTDRFSVTLGGRWFNIETDRTLENGALIPSTIPFTVQGPEINCDDNGQTTPSGTAMTDNLCWTGVRNTAESDEDGFVPKVTGRYDFTDDNMIYFTYSEGFRRGGGNAARPSSIFGRPPLDQFTSDLVTNYEVGTKNTLANGKVQFNLTAYHMVWDDMQIEVEDPTPNIFTLGIANVAEAEIDGVEAFLSWLPAEQMSIDASIGYNDAKLSKDDVLFEGTGSEIFIIQGSRLPLTPDWKANVNLDYAFRGKVLNAQPSLNLNFNYTGETVSSLAGIASTEVLNPVRTSEAYSITNLRFGLGNDSWSATLFINNVFNEYAELYFNDRWIQTRLSVNRPRNYGITFRKNFH
jgi:outer membrane receptor protein involved in Fe transport